MADNVTADPGTGGATFKTDEDTGASAHVPVTKIELGAANSFDGYVSSSNPMPVTGTITAVTSLTNALPAGTNNIGDVDVLSVIPGTGATNLGKAIDSAAGATDSGVAVLAIRDDALATLTPVEGDYNALRVDSTGALWVRAAGGSVDDTTTLTSGTTEGSLIMAAASPTDTSVDANDIAAVGMTTDRRLYVDTELPTAAALADNTANPTVPAVGAFALVFDGTTWDRMPGTSADGVTVNLGTNNDVTVTGTVTANLAAGTNNIGDVDILSIAAGDNNIGNVDIVTMPNVTLAAGTNTNEVVGDVAHDAAAAGNPVLIAARATNSVEGLTQVAAADSSYITADLNGCIVTRPHTTLEEIISERVSDTGGTSTAFTNFAAGGAGIHNYVTTISIYNSSATNGYVDFRDGAAGSVLFTAAAPATGGSVINLPVPLKTSANTALAYDVSGALSTVYISVIGFQAQG